MGKAPVETTYHKGDPGFHEANEMARRMWDAVADQDQPVNIQYVYSAVVLFMVNLLDHWEPEQREEAATMLAHSIIETMRIQQLPGVKH